MGERLGCVIIQLHQCVRLESGLSEHGFRINKIVCALAALAASLLPRLGHAASFDCAKAARFVEQAICANATLSQLDDALSENYRSMRAANIGDGARKDLQATRKK